MVECAISENAELTIVSRDSDYGVMYEDVAYVNDHLRHEFSDRVSKRRKLVLHAKLSEALKRFKIQVTPEEEQEEASLVAEERTNKSTKKDTTNYLLKLIEEWQLRTQADHQGES